LREHEIQRPCRRYDRVEALSNTKAATGKLSRYSSPTRVLYEGCLFCSLTRGPDTPCLPTYCELHVAIPARRACACRKEPGFSIHHFSAPWPPPRPCPTQGMWRRAALVLCNVVVSPDLSHSPSGPTISRVGMTMTERLIRDRNPACAALDRLWYEAAITIFQGWSPSLLDGNRCRKHS
jgi:hypothetical protein